MKNQNTFLGLIFLAFSVFANAEEKYLTDSSGNKKVEKINSIEKLHSSNELNVKNLKNCTEIPYDNCFGRLGPYEGEFHNGKYNGWGKFATTPNSFFIGVFKDDKAQDVTLYVNGKKIPKDENIEEKNRKKIYEERSKRIIRESEEYRNNNSQFSGSLTEPPDNQAYPSSKKSEILTTENDSKIAWGKDRFIDFKYTNDGLEIGKFINNEFVGGFVAYDNHENFLLIFTKYAKLGLPLTTIYKKLSSTFKGSWYYGLYKDGQRNGQGVLTENGEIVGAGDWENGKLIKEVDSGSQVRSGPSVIERLGNAAKAYQEWERQNSPINCTSTRSGETVFTNCR